MVERQRGIEEKRSYFPENIDSAYDISSGGMGIHLNAVTAFATGRELAKWARGSLKTYSSNYLVNPYVFGWRGRDDFFRDSGPHVVTPRNEDHLSLFEATDNEYDRLHRAQLRLVLAGEAIEATRDLDAPLTDPNEFKDLLAKASARGLVEYDPFTSPEVTLADDDFTLAVNLMKAGIQCSDQLWARLEEIRFSDRFKERTLQAAVHKLGCMLALTDQLTFDAQALGIPISKNYKPARAQGAWEENWQRLFGKPMPGLGGLYQEAHEVLVTHSDSQDPLVAHLRPLTELPQLVA